MTATPPPSLSARAVELSADGTPLLRGVDLDCPPRTLIAIVGPSGGGKSTLLRCFNRLEEVDGGSVLVDGVDVRELDPLALRRRIGMVFQAPVLFSGTVRDNLAFADPAVDDAVLAACLDDARLPKTMLDRAVAGLSGGEAQRVTIARALVHRPDVLLLDEPTASLDRDATLGIEELVRDLVDGQGLTAVLVSHDLDQTRRVADLSALMVAGRIRRTGTPDEIGQGWQEDVR